MVENLIETDDCRVLFCDSKELPVKTKHVCYYTRADRHDNIELLQVYTAFYKHPLSVDLDGGVLVPVVETRLVTSQSRGSLLGAVLVLLEAAQKAVLSALDGFVK